MLVTHVRSQLGCNVKTLGFITESAFAWSPSGDSALRGGGRDTEFKLILSSL